MKQSIWTDDLVARLRELWGSGRRAVEIAAVLGVSRNAIIGKAHRLNLHDLRGPYRSKMISKGILQFHREHPDASQAQSEFMRRYWCAPGRRQEKSRQMMEYWAQRKRLQHSVLSPSTDTGG